MKTLFGLSWRVLHKCHCPRAGRPPSARLRAQPHARSASSTRRRRCACPPTSSVALMAMLVFLFGAAAWSRARRPRRRDADAGRAAPVLRRAAGLLRRADRRAVGRRRLRLLARARRASAGAGAPACSSAWRSPPSTTPSSCRRCCSPHCAVRRLAARASLPPLARRSSGWRTLGPVVYLACWPWLWFDTVARFREYVAFHVHHVYYNMEYLGRNYNKPPFPLSFPYVMDALTAAGDHAAAGAGRRRRAGARLAAGAPRRRAGDGSGRHRPRRSTRAPPACSSPSTRSSRWPS